MKSKKAMKKTIKGLAFSAFVLLSLNLFAQDDTYHIETVFKGGKASVYVHQRAVCKPGRGVWWLVC